jgi:hypothetical protein
MDKIIFNILLVIIIIYIFFTSVEHLENTGPTDAIKEAVKQVYLADVESIRNLSAVAKKLHEDGALVTPTNMSIRGKLNVNSPGDAKALPANVCLSVDNATETTIRLKTKADDAKNINLTNNDGNLTMGNAKGADLLNIKADGNVAIKQDLTTGSLTSSTIKAPGPMKIESTAITTTGSLTTGALVAASLTTSGDVKGNIITGEHARINGNLHFNGGLFFNNMNTRDYTPIVINFAPHHNMQLVVNHQSFVCLTWGDADALNRRDKCINRLKTFTLFESTIKLTGSVININDYREVRDLIISVPPGKLVKIFGNQGPSSGFETLGPGYHQKTLSFRPHLIWAGFTENKHHFPDNLDVSRIAENNGQYIMNL